MLSGNLIRWSRFLFLWGLGATLFFAPFFFFANSMMVDAVSNGSMRQQKFTRAGSPGLDSDEEPTAVPLYKDPRAVALRRTAEQLAIPGLFVLVFGFIWAFGEWADRRSDVVVIDAGLTSHSKYGERKV